MGIDIIMVILLVLFHFQALPGRYACSLLNREYIAYRDHSNGVMKIPLLFDKTTLNT